MLYEPLRETLRKLFLQSFELLSFLLIKAQVMELFFNKLMRTLEKGIYQ